MTPQDVAKTALVEASKLIESHEIRKIEVVILDKKVQIRVCSEFCSMWEEMNANIFTTKRWVREQVRSLTRICCELESK